MERGYQESKKFWEAVLKGADEAGIADVVKMEQKLVEAERKMERLVELSNELLEKMGKEDGKG
jgi:hypothetical protein